MVIRKLTHCCLITMVLTSTSSINYIFRFAVFTYSVSVLASCPVCFPYLADMINPDYAIALKIFGKTSIFTWLWHKRVSPQKVTQVRRGTLIPLLRAFVLHCYVSAICRAPPSSFIPRNAGSIMLVSCILSCKRQRRIWGGEISTFLLWYKKDL